MLTVNIQELRSLVHTELAKLPVVQGGQLSSDYTLEDFLKECQKEAEALGDTYVSLEHFLIEWCGTSTFLLLSQAFLNIQGLHEMLCSHMQTLRKGKTVKEKNAEKQYQMLEKYCKNITEQARDGKLRSSYWPA